ncbi:alpha/beta fold hydrolase [Georgenia ruanii]|uniref:Alpha/beta fold hydrolase n=1 Tax=Georgenia ruanii TaxID=348442 RepID=A0A7J9V3K5_9MICO|nr:alpha/beta hydrolase [Georgenia ruanii]MPV90534.1 alpha/beta fold hydrolase [Georgenia ruanii]
MTTLTPPRDFSDRTWSSWTEPSFIEVDGLPTAYRRAGTGPTLVYLHGGGGTRSWTPLYEQLAAHYDLVAPEHPGYGDTGRPDHVDSWPDLVLHYEAFFRALDLGEIHLVGTSLGAWLAANLAIYYPERFASLTLVTPLGTRILDEPFIDVFRFTPEQEAEAMFNGRADRYAEALAQGDELDTIVHAFGENAMAALLFFNPRYDYKLDMRLQRVAAPTLVLGVDDDRVVGNQQAARYSELIPGATLRTIHGPDGEPSGHGVTVEQPDDVVAAITAHTAATN